MSSLASRRRYWARSMIGYPRLNAAQPNAAHTVLAYAEKVDTNDGDGDGDGRGKMGMAGGTVVRVCACGVLVHVVLLQSGCVHHVITQNVDGLHHKAGSSRVTMLHGDIHVVQCMACAQQISRGEMQMR